MVVLGSNECHVSVSLGFFVCLFVLDTKMLIAVDLKKVPATSTQKTH